MESDFDDFVREILETYIVENPDIGDILTEQLSGISRLKNEVNGYGAYSNITIDSKCRRIPEYYSSSYLKNDFYIRMEGREYELGFILSKDENGLIDLLEIFPNDGVGWDGVIKKYEFFKIDNA